MRKMPMLREDASIRLGNGGGDDMNLFAMIAGEPEIEPICYTRKRKPIEYGRCTLWLQRRNRSEFLGRITEFCGLVDSEEAEPAPDCLCALQKRELRMLKRREGRENVYAVLFPTFGNESLKQVFKARVRCEAAGEYSSEGYICRVWFSELGKIAYLRLLPRAMTELRQKNS